MVAGAPQTPPNPYLYTGAASKVDYTPNTFTVDPSVCPVSFSCQLLTGPRSDVDLCSVDDGTTQGTFSTSSGQFTFQSTDLASYPAGTYRFRVTGTVGNKSDAVEFDMVLVDPCPNVSLTLL